MTQWGWSGRRGSRNWRRLHRHCRFETASPPRDGPLVIAHGQSPHFTYNLKLSTPYSPSILNKPSPQHPKQPCSFARLTRRTRPPLNLSFDTQRDEGLYPPMLNATLSGRLGQHSEIADLSPT